MKRQGSLDEISDGRLYSRHDMVRAGCGGCRGCSACCHGMGVSAILDPLDVCRLSQGTGLSAELLLADKLELNVVDGIILPNLRMGGEEEACGFLDAEGRCSVHPYRPGVCRLFPLGRYYRETSQETLQQPGGAASFSYFLQVHECPAPNKTKVRVEKWLEQPDIARYEEYILQWHNFLERAQAFAGGNTSDEELKTINLYILKQFFLQPYDLGRDFYAQFEERLETFTLFSNFSL
ncbi:MAG: YkgJ family cysteine cluster protein [Clostridiales bacterium]|nr:YkgJ family cysteine cluster protein [Clostridiales bacterium]